MIADVNVITTVISDGETKTLGAASKPGLHQIIGDAFVNATALIRVQDSKAREGF